jgi:hypothetical protein
VRYTDSPRSIQKHAENGRGRGGFAEFERERLARESHDQDDHDVPMQAPERAQERERDKEQERERDRDREGEGEGSSTCSSDVTRCSTSAPAPQHPPAQGVISHTQPPLSGSPKPVSQKALSLGGSKELVEVYLHRVCCVCVAHVCVRAHVHAL